jgi:hydrogenase/urease accessory protein HupE
MQSASVNRTEENDVEFVLEYPRPPSGRLSFTLAYLQKMTEDHNATLSVSDEAGANLGWEELSPGQPVYVATLPPDAKTAASAPLVPVKSLFGRFVLLGIKHILTGYDHLLFLAGLLVVCRRLKTMVTIITCFTVAHSITLALAALGLVAVSGRIVEPLIAASIVFVGVENLLRSGEPRGRWLLTAGFGLIHGFGFAGALIEAGLGSNGTPMLVPLFSFNLGVELGQLTVAAVFVPILWQIRKWPPFARYGTTIISVLIALAGGYWFLERTLLSS